MDLHAATVRAQIQLHAHASWGADYGILGGALSALWMPRRVFERPYTDSVHGVLWAVASTLVCHALQWYW